MKTLWVTLIASVLVLSLAGSVSAAKPEGAGPKLVQCNDNIDNDGDGKIDFPADPGCANKNDRDEFNAAPPPPAACGNGLDDDADGKVDYPADPGCTSLTDTSEVDPTPPPPDTDTVPSTIPANCSSDVSAALQTWLNGRPNGSTLTFPSGSCYLVEAGLSLSGRSNLTLVGTGSTLRASTVGDGHRPNIRLTNGSNLTVRGFRLEGGYTTPGTHNTSVQWSHGIESLGVQTLLVENVTAVNVGGDCVYLGLGTARTRDATVRGLTCTGTGRNGVSFVAADRSRVESSSTQTIGYIPFDVEPNSGAGFGVDTAVITGNTIGNYVINAFTIVGEAPVANVTFSNNNITASIGGRIQVTGTSRRSNVTISGNTATQNLSYPQAIRLDNVDGAVVTNNTIPTTGVMLRCASVTALTFSGNNPQTSAGCTVPPPPTGDTANL